jgi:hypothetical protein
MEPATAANQSSRLEPMQVEGPVVENAPALGIRIEQDLEAAIETKAVHDVGAHTTADAVSGLEDLEGNSGFVQA